MSESSSSSIVAAAVMAAVATITPTIGRRVWYWPSEEDFKLGRFSADPKQPFDAGVIFVHLPDAEKVNLLVTDHNGCTFAVAHVALRTLSENCEAEPGTATWMPYQIQKAKEEASEPAK